MDRAASVGRIRFDFLGEYINVQRVYDFWYDFKGEHCLYMRPIAEPVRLMVREDQVQATHELLKEVNQQHRE
jgi:hypothetical protein